jgi:hypothetical protein
LPETAISSIRICSPADCATDGAGVPTTKAKSTTRINSGLDMITILLIHQQDYKHAARVIKAYISRGLSG